MVLTKAIGLVLCGVDSLLQRGTPLTREAAGSVRSVLSTALAGMSDATAQVSRLALPMPSAILVSDVRLLKQGCRCAARLFLCSISTLIMNGCICAQSATVLDESALTALCELLWLSTGGLLAAALAVASEDALGGYSDALVDVSRLLCLSV